MHALRLELLAELGLAMLLGGLIGLERELKHKPAGLRTNILICAGCTFFTDLSRRMGAEGADPARIAAQMVAGLGFLGAGVILHSGGAVVGITTAATIWMVAAIGMALGFGAYLDAIAATVLVLIVLAGLGRMEARLAKRAATTLLRVHVAAGVDGEEVAATLRRLGIEVGIADGGQPGVVALELRGPWGLHERALELLREHPGVRKTEAE